METLKDIFKFLSKTDKRLLYCIKADPHCLNFLCNFGKKESVKEASVHIQLEGRPAVFEVDETSALEFEIRTVAFPEPNPKVIELNKDENVAYVLLEGLPHQRSKRLFTLLIISNSLLLGLIVLLLILYVMWKSGFFKKKSVLQEENRRRSCSYVNSKSNNDDRRLLSN
ncbi:integrin alpha-4-like [Choloepus didactylus]|uniref:integrin alpha-4-like n=1 Tax=Choloepus didactylus TaxID=27675 RepID=UPI0018A0ABC4|nr:integrin alpha-4-like [Choloepus didactylus]